MADQIINKFKLKRSSNPLPIGFLGRKRGVDFRQTTLETWKKIIPADRYYIRAQDKEIIIDGKVKLLFGGLDNQDTINKFNSAELVFFGIDQAEETTREEVSVLRGSLRLKHKGVQPTYKEFYTANPSDCWLKEDFVDRQNDGYAYIPALPTDNPHLPDNYIETLEEAFKHSKPLLEAYRDGNWHALKSSNVLLSTEDLRKLQGLDIHFPKEKRVVVCDPATSHDECVIYFLKDYRIEDQMFMVGEQDEMKIAGMIAAFARKNGCNDVGGDSIGIGAGIFSRLEELGDFNVHRINSSESKIIPPEFLNKRALFYWRTMQAVLDKRIHYPEDEELRRQLINITYEVVNSRGQIKITDKDKIKKVISRSPDRADAFAMGIYLSDDVEPYSGKQDAYAMETDDYPYNPMTV